MSSFSSIYLTGQTKTLTHNKWLKKKKRCFKYKLWVGLKVNACVQISLPPLTLDELSDLALRPSSHIYKMGTAILTLQGYWGRTTIEYEFVLRNTHRYCHFQRVYQCDRPFACKAAISWGLIQLNIKHDGRNRYYFRYGVTTVYEGRTDSILKAVIDFCVRNCFQNIDVFISIMTCYPATQFIMYFCLFCEKFDNFFYHLESLTK